MKSVALVLTTRHIAMNRKYTNPL